MPYGNGRKMVDAVRATGTMRRTWRRAENLASTACPESATGQYDRLYNAYASGDADEAQAAVEKLVAMGQRASARSTAS